MQAVIDRIEDGIAVILIEEVQQEWTTNEVNLPAGSEAGTWLNVEQTTAGWNIIGIDEEATKAATASAQRLQQKLQKKKKRSKFKR